MFSVPTFVGRGLVNLVLESLFGWAAGPVKSDNENTEHNRPDKPCDRADWVNDHCNPSAKCSNKNAPAPRKMRVKRCRKQAE